MGRPTELLIILLIIVLLFDTKKLKNIGSDLGSAIKGFRKSISDEEDKAAATTLESQNTQGKTIDSTAEKIDEKH